MADEILIKYGVDITGLQKAETAVTDVTAAVTDMQQKVKVAFSQKELDQAVQKLEEQGMVLESLILKYGDATKAFKGASKELQNMAVSGEQGSKKYKEMEKVVAELRDTIDDTRNSVKRLSSDTRLIDSVAQGMLGLAAAGSVVTGAMATLGSENKEVEKTLLKVQGAMATLQGVQELATIATEKGGIATQAYGVALQVVDKISKVTGASMAASWALATGGITLVVGAIVGLIYWLNQEAETEEQIANRKKELAYIDELRKNKEITQIQNRRLELENEFKQRLAIAKTEIEQTEIQIEREKALKNEVEARVKGITAAANSVKQAYGEENAQYVALKNEILKGNSSIADSNIRLAQLQKQLSAQIIDARKKEIDAFKKQFAELDGKSKDLLYQQLEGVVSGAQQTIEKLPPVQVKVELTPLDSNEKLTAWAQAFNKYKNIAEIAVSDISRITATIFDNQVTQLQQQKDRELAIAGDNTKKREEIEKKFAVNSAILARKQAQANKAIAITNIILSLAQAIAKATEKGFPAAYADIALASASAAVQTGIVASQPLPEIPQYEKGGAVVLAGGRMNDGHLIGRSHRQGGILINAQGGEYIWDIPTVKRHGDIIKAAHENRLEDLILHQYVAPMLEQKAMKAATASNYDDFMLRATIKQGHDKERRNAEYIAQTVSKAVTQSVYNKNRFQ